MNNGKSITEVSAPKREQTCIQNHHHLEYNPEHEVLISLANEMFGPHTWSHTVTFQNIDYIDHEGSEYSVGVMALVKVELKNGIHHQDEAVTNGLREALRSFGCHLTRKVNGSCRHTDVSVQLSAFEMSPEMEEHSLLEEVPISNRHLTDTSALTTCLQTANDNLKLERKRRQRQKQEEFLHQLKRKQSTNLTVSSDLQTKLLMDKNTGIRNNEEKENDLMDDETLISTQELDRVVQSAEVQQSRTPLVCSPPKRTMQTSPWPPVRDTIIPRQLLMQPRIAGHNMELNHSKNSA
ncbi:DNA repair protein RAD52 homolog isoform X2 [Zootermopsis nevadensis]|uniref:DNA repair protein RAD52 homolog isoform X2 n=1 Tax=Zootermopsis nevadensis TaxID=136037 RepID=UPI000B8E77C8|nr:DNA repair protein RAD52 homolog isoform X2 [Zootermopsis nevadensis]